LSGDGKFVVTGSSDRTAILWEAASGKKLQTFAGHTGEVHGVAISGDGALVLTGSGDKTAILWEAAGGKKLQTFEGAKAPVFLSGDGKHIVTRSLDDQSAILWDAASGKKSQTFEGHTARVTGVVLSGDARHVLTGSWDGNAILWAVNAAPSVFPPVDPAWLVLVAKMTAREQVEAVKAELMRRNPGFDGKLKEKILGGVVTELNFRTDM